MLRSRLYWLEPKGIGTPYIESIISYITRLAEKHSVPVYALVNYELVPELQKEIGGKCIRRIDTLWTHKLKIISQMGVIFIHTLSVNVSHLLTLGLRTLV